MTSARPWLAAVLVLFCLPLFVNLGQEDLENDEAIYSFAIDRMLASGDWLVPKALPHDDLAFFEKPPLKLWIVAAPIRAGLLPHNEFGLRFWDALFGAAAFVYVFLLGTRLLNPLCGAIAVLMLFAHAPLLFGHGLRSNNMEAPLVLAYCGGVYHYLAWARGAVRLKADATDVPVGSALRRTFTPVPHLFAVALYFVLAFMTKFVAALFLPVILALSALIVRDHRRIVIRDWRVWTAASLLAVALIAPWFVFASARFGGDFWRAIFGVHVYQRFTSYLDPGHLRPWHFYLTQMVAFWDSAALAVMFAGLGVLAAWTARRLAPDVVVIVLWFVLPMAVISAGTSKIYHYAYPFLPALALGGGYLLALTLAVAPAPFNRALDRVYTRATKRLPRTARLLRRPALRAGLVLGIGVCMALAIGSLAFGQVRLMVGDTELKSSGVLRPGLAAFVFAVLLGIGPSARRALVTLFVASFLPLQGYRDSLMLLGVTPHSKRSTSECIRAVQTRSADLPSGLRVELADAAVSHSLFYYFERIRPWVRDASDDRRPALIKAPAPPGMASASLSEDVAVTLPGPYAACRTASRTHEAHEPSSMSREVDAVYLTAVPPWLRRP